MGNLKIFQHVSLVHKVFTLSDFQFSSTKHKRRGRRIRSCTIRNDFSKSRSLDFDISDAAALLSYLFGGLGELPDPFDECGSDPTDNELGCEEYLPSCSID